MGRLIFASIGGVFVLLALGFVVMGFVTAGDHGEFRERGRAAEAEVLEKSKGRTLRTPRYDLELGFETEQGKPIRATLSDLPMSYWADIEPGDEVSVVYLSDDPSQVRRAKDVETDSRSVGLMAAMGVLVLSSPFWLGFWWLTRRARRAEKA